MATTHKKWPGLSISDSDNDITTRVRESDGILKSVEKKTLLMIAAALSVKQNAPTLAVGGAESTPRQIIHPSLMSKPDYLEYRQYIALIYFLTDGNRDLKNMSDVSVMVKTFLDYAQRGLRIIDTNYLSKKDGSDELMKELVLLLNKK